MSGHGIGRKWPILFAGMYPGQALAARLMKAEKIWNHDAFFAYADRWMCEDETEFAKAIVKALMAEGVPELNHEISLQGKTRLPFVDDMWARYRAMPGMPPTDDWKNEHKDPPPTGKEN